MRRSAGVATFSAGEVEGSRLVATLGVEMGILGEKPQDLECGFLCRIEMIYGLVYRARQ
jgi:hypothetical protein